MRAKFVELRRILVPMIRRITNQPDFIEYLDVINSVFREFWPLQILQFLCPNQLNFHIHVGPSRNSSTLDMLITIENNYLYTLLDAVLVNKNLQQSVHEGILLINMLGSLLNFCGYSLGQIQRYFSLCIYYLLISTFPPFLWSDDYNLVNMLLALNHPQLSSHEM